MGLRFLIDYENVGEYGLDGIEYLGSADALEIFYSQSRKTISKKMMDIIFASGCEFKAFELERVGKNALDYYIASRVGELIGGGCTEKLIMVSRDKGFRAIRDFWETQGIPRTQILIRHAIRDGIISSGESSIRRQKIIDENMPRSIEREYVKYTERLRMQTKLEELFKGTAYESHISEIFELTENSGKPKEMYTGSLRRFGREKGTEIYRMLKQEGFPAMKEA